VDECLGGESESDDGRPPEGIELVGGSDGRTNLRGWVAAIGSRQQVADARTVPTLRHPPR
jgi:hypothetical protein